MRLIFEWKVLALWGFKEGNTNFGLWNGNVVNQISGGWGNIGIKVWDRTLMVAR